MDDVKCLGNLKFLVPLEKSKSYMLHVITLYSLWNFVDLQDMICALL